jgi:ubiquinone/menaquinone biosynthesis C-methylase UbiE
MLTADFSRLALKPGALFLDAGCGTGRHACEAYRRPGVGVVGVDMNMEDLRRAAYTLFTMENEAAGFWAVSKADVTRLPFEDGTFDVVLCSEVLEHIPDNRKAVSELVRVLKPGGDCVVTVPRYFPERVCWALSREYHNEPGGHIRIYRTRQLLSLLENAGLRYLRMEYRHALHAPYWWLKCLVGHRRDDSRLVNSYRRFLEWDIMKQPRLTRMLDRLLNPIIAKSVVFYLKKN